MTGGIEIINSNLIHSITSGQVIIDLASSVKELVENAVDAHASVVEVRFKNHGVDSLEVIDDGDGIAKNDFIGLGRKHYTSKLRSYDDLLLVQTLGFRGEAINSLCSLAKVEVITSTVNDIPLATKLLFDSTGEIISKTETSGKKGTHVIVCNLFESLPVRRKDFLKNFKREFSKAISLLQAYAVICTDVKIIVSNTSGPSNKKTVLFSTTGKGGLKSSVANIFGVSIFEKLIPINLSFTLFYSFPRSLKKPETSLNDESATVEIEGFISKPIFGNGRSASDRQLYFINSRPCSLPQIAKAINETYKVFNNTQLPVVVANIKLDTTRYDINVSPDKRTILLHNESGLIELVRENFSELFEKVGHSVPLNKVDTVITATKINQNALFCSNHRELEKDEEIQINNFNKTSAFKQKYDRLDQDNVLISNEESLSRIRSNERNNDDLTIRNNDIDEEVINNDDNKQHLKTATRPSKTSDQTLVDLPHQCSPKDCFHGYSEECVTEFNSKEKEEKRHFSNSSVQAETFKFNEATSSSFQTVSRSGSQRNRTYNYDISLRVSKNQIGICKKELLRLQKIRNKGYIRASDRLKINNQNSEKHLSSITISDISENTEIAESMLDMTIHKKDFLNMEVIGQFNLGFILVTNYNEDNHRKDLFIVDQHASDEIYNFERLQRETTIKTQPLISPLPLELTVMEEITLMSNLTVFDDNGFKVKIDENAPPGHKCQLIALPTSKSTKFDTKDLQELIYILETQPGKKNIRCSKLRAMYAMRACRSSIMIGKPLNRLIMERVVRNLSALDKPWNCPHGRPTMRHLVSLSQFYGSYDDYLKISSLSQ